MNSCNFLHKKKTITQTFFSPVILQRPEAFLSTAVVTRLCERGRFGSNLLTNKEKTHEKKYRKTGQEFTDGRNGSPYRSRQHLVSSMCD